MDDTPTATIRILESRMTSNTTSTITTPRIYFNITQAIYNVASLDVILTTDDPINPQEWRGQRCLGDYLDLGDSLSRYMMTPAGDHGNWAVCDGAGGICLGSLQTDDYGSLVLVVVVTRENVEHPDVARLIEMITCEVPCYLTLDNPHQM